MSELGQNRKTPQPSRLDVFSRRDSARNNRLGLKNLNDVAALVYRTAEKDYRAAIGSRARRRNFNDFALAAKPLKNVRSTACFTRSLTAQAARLELPVARCSAALFRASMALTELECPFQNAPADGPQHQTKPPPFEVLAVAYDDHVNVGRAVGLTREGVGVARRASPHVGVGRL